MDRRTALRRLLIGAGASAAARAAMARAAPPAPVAAATAGPVRGAIAEGIRAHAAMQRATTFMVETVSTGGGYVWAYLPDLSRRWGEIEARASMIWIQAPGTPAVGQLFLDAYHATRDEAYYRAARRVAGALVRGQHPSGGWNYVVDLAGDASLRDWYDTVGRNAWRLEEFQRYADNATFDDRVTVDAATFLLRLYLEKHDPADKRALDRAIRFVLDSQHASGGWPQRFPPRSGRSAAGGADYSSYLTFNDDVAGGNIEFLVHCYQTLGDRRLLEPLARGMRAFLVTQQAAPQPGWALQYTVDLEPAGARSYEPRALATHTTARNVELLVRFYRLTGDSAFLARVPEALDWLDRVALPAGLAAPGRTHPTFIELGTNRPLYVHREGSNVVNGRYFVNGDPDRTLGHYSAFRRIDVAGLRALHAEVRALTPVEARRGSPLAAGAGREPLPRFFVVDQRVTTSPADVIGSLNAQGFWPARLGRASHPYRGHGARVVSPGDFASTQVGDETDTSPFPDDTLTGISTAAYIRNMSVLIRFVEGGAG